MHRKDVVEDCRVQGIFPIHPRSIHLLPTHLALERVTFAQLDPDRRILRQKKRTGPDFAAMRGKIGDFSSRAASRAIAAMARQNNLIAIFAPIIWDRVRFHVKRYNPDWLKAGFLAVKLSIPVGITNR